MKLCTTAFLVEISQYIKFGDLTTIEGELHSATDTESPMQYTEAPKVVDAPAMYIQMPDADDVLQEEQNLTGAEEEALLRESTASFADWIANFIRRVILLLENLPEEGTDGSPRGGESEGLLPTIHLIIVLCGNLTS